jgi:hypothetical protein
MLALRRHPESCAASKEPGGISLQDFPIASIRRSICMKWLSGDCMSVLLLAGHKKSGNRNDDRMTARRPYLPTGDEWNRYNLDARQDFDLSPT